MIRRPGEIDVFRIVGVLRAAGVVVALHDGFTVVDPQVGTIQTQHVVLTGLAVRGTGVFLADRISVEKFDHPLPVGFTDRETGFQPFDLAVDLRADRLILRAVGVTAYPVQPVAACAGTVKRCPDFFQDLQTFGSFVRVKRFIADVVRKLIGLHRKLIDVLGYVVGEAFSSLRKEIRHRLIQRHADVILRYGTEVGVGLDRRVKFGIRPQHALGEPFHVVSGENFREPPAGPLLQLPAQIVGYVYFRPDRHLPLFVRMLRSFFYLKFAEPLGNIMRRVQAEALETELLLRRADLILTVRVSLVNGGIDQIKLCIRQDRLVADFGRYREQSADNVQQPSAVACHHLFFGHAGQFAARSDQRVQFFLNSVNDPEPASGSVTGDPVPEGADPVPGGPFVPFLACVIKRRDIPAHGLIQCMNSEICHRSTPEKISNVLHILL